MEAIGQGKYMSELLRGNNFTPCNNFNTSITESNDNKKLKTETTGANPRDTVKHIFGGFSALSIDTSALDQDQEKVAFKHLNMGIDKLIEIEKATIQQSKCDMWYLEQSYRLTASNFGAIATNIFTQNPY